MLLLCCWLLSSLHNLEIHHHIITISKIHYLVTRICNTNTNFVCNPRLPKSASGVQEASVDGSLLTPCMVETVARLLFGTPGVWLLIVMGGKSITATQNSVTVLPAPQQHCSSAHLRINIVPKLMYPFPHWFFPRKTPHNRVLGSRLDLKCNNNLLCLNCTLVSLN